MSAGRPTDVDRYLSRLIPRGGRIGPHADGWGVAYFEGRASRIFKDASPAAESRYLAILAKARLKSTAVVAHIRKANPAIVGRATANTHPFEREWNGRSWVFAHNGKLPGIQDQADGRGGRFKPLGDTDSEQAFCLLLNAMAQEIDCGDEVSPRSIQSALMPVVDMLSRLGEFNFILSNGEYTIVHAHTRLHVLEKSPDAAARGNPVALLATAPLTGENWRPLSPGSTCVYKEGRLAG
ncbi:MAG: class II glutamine amidotransferase [Burkholderiales bacterium]|nr:class II glutamine amidotransferase [Burkholderiales bacterium]